MEQGLQQGAEGWWCNAHGRCLASDGCLASLVFTLQERMGTTRIVVAKVEVAGVATPSELERGVF